MSIDDVECVWPVAAVLGEGPMWSAPDQTLWFVDIKGNAIHAFDERTGARRSFATPQFAAFIFRDLAGGYVCGLKSGLHRFDPEQGSFQCIVEVDAEHLKNGGAPAETMAHDVDVGLIPWHEFTVDVHRSVFQHGNLLFPKSPVYAGEQ